MSNKLSQLKQFIAIHYDLDELRTLCFDLGVDFEELPEVGKTARIQEFLLLLGKQHRYNNLLVQLEKERTGPFHQAEFDTSSETEEALYRGLPTLKKPDFLTSRELRDRLNVLRNVETTWIDGFLKQSLHMEILKLTHTFQADAVSRNWGIALRRPGQEDNPLPVEKPLREVFDDYGRRLLILGAPGSGKTITLLQLAQQLIQEAYEQPGLPIPVVLNLSSWAQRREPLGDWIVEEMFTQYQVAKRITQKWIDDGQLLYLLDGLDEVAEGYRESCLAAINKFLEQHSAEIVVCSRKEDYERLSQRLNLSIAIQIEPLTEEDIQQYLSQDELGLRAVKATLETDSELLSLARSPLMLSIMTLAYLNVEKERLTPLSSMEARRHYLFNHYAESGFIHRPLPESQPFNKKQAFDWLTHLACDMQKNSQSIFHIERLQPSLLPAGKHHCFKATVGLMSGLLIGLLVGLAVGLPDGFIVGLLSGLAGSVLGGVSIAVGVWLSAMFSEGWSRFAMGGLSSGLLVGLLAELLVKLLFWPLFRSIDGLQLGLFYGLPGALIAYFTEIESVQIISFSRPTRHGLLKRVRQGFLSGLLSGLFFTLLFRLVNEPTPGLSYGWSAALVYGLILGLALGLIFGVIGGLMSMIKPRSTTETLRPNQGMRSSLVNAVRVSLLLGSLAGFIGWQLSGLNKVEGFSSLFILVLPISFLHFGGAAVLHHVALRLLLSRYNTLPLRLALFCDEMANRVLLHRVGGGWIFVHRYLLEYFASSKQDSIPNSRTEI